MLIGLPEHRVPLPGGSRSSQTDLMVIARNSASELVAIAVEGKVHETFGEKVGTWRRTAPTGGREKRLGYLCSVLGLPAPRALADPPDGAFEALWYQLLHRTASALIEARRFGAAHAVMLVHSFCPDDADGHDAFARFAEHLGLPRPPGRGEVLRLPTDSAPALWLGWVRSPVIGPVAATLEESEPHTAP